MSTKNIFVAGSGLVGLAAAAKLAQRGYSVVLAGDAGPVFDTDNYGLRVYALNQASCQLLRDLGVWQAIKSKRIFPYTDMHIWDSEHGGQLDFHAVDLGVSELGTVVEDLVLRSVLFEHLQKQPSVKVCCPAKVIAIDHDQQSWRVTLSNQQVYEADLVLGIDGANSWVRQYMGVFWNYTDYRQNAIVAVVEHELPHKNTCWQQFYGNSILALLPLSDNYSSMVWSCSNELSQQLMTTSDEEFTSQLATALGSRLGKLTLHSQRVSFPLFGGYADRYVQNGLALLGDAAHHIHPLAGQGVNLGLADVVVLDQVLAGQPPRLPQLRRYERRVSERNRASQLFMEGLNRVFTGGQAPLSVLGDHVSATTPTEKLIRKMFCTYGMNTVNRCLPIRTWFARHALGLVD